MAGLSTRVDVVGTVYKGKLRKKISADTFDESFALFQNKCGGVLISNNYVVTAGESASHHFSSPHSKIFQYKLFLLSVLSTPATFRSKI